MKFADILADAIRVGYHMFMFCIYVAVAFILIVIAVVGGWGLCEIVK